MDVQAIWFNFRDAVSRHYFDMRGRVGRAQFWYFALASFVFAILAGFLQAATWLPVSALFHLAMILPWVGMGARRLQDVGRDGKLVWLCFILFAATQIVGVFTALAFIATGPFGLIFAPGLGLAGLASLTAALVLIYFWVQPGNPGDNAYGPPPPVFDPSAKPAA